MIFKQMFIKNKDEKKASSFESINELFTKAQKSHDFGQFSLTNEKGHFILSYYNTLIDRIQLQRRVIPIFQEPSFDFSQIKKIEDIKHTIPIEDIFITDNIEAIQTKLLKGYAILQIKENDNKVALINLSNEKDGLRKQNKVENEYSVVGPQIGFIENVNMNIHLIRQQINTPDLITQEIHIGSLSHTKVVIAYIEGVTNKQYIETITERLKKIDFDVVFDSSQLHQIISDNSFTPFPLLLSTERIDRTVFGLIKGQVALFSNGSGYAILGPATLIDFFTSPEDYYLPWLLASFFRLIRIFSVLFSIFATSIYIAVLTYHYEMIPKVLLGPLSFSRHNVPFPPVLEVLFLEFTIELLREAGARLPTKVGQTLGIVGGIVIGQASVEAAFTSNVLLIIVALSALASFTTPIYQMSNTIRFLRFPLIVIASIWGGFGIAIGICFLIVHLTRLQSLNSPYSVPFYPLRPRDLTDSLIRSPYSMTTKRPSFLRPKSLWRYHTGDKKRKGNDFDE